MTWEWLSINMKTIKTRYFPKVSHNGLGPQLSLTMVSGHNHLLRQYLGSIGNNIQWGRSKMIIIAAFNRDYDHSPCFFWYPHFNVHTHMRDNFCDRKLGTKMVRKRCSDSSQRSEGQIRRVFWAIREGHATNKLWGEQNTTGWWFQTWILFNIWDVILPIDELIFFKMVKTTKQTINQEISLACGCICV